ncbi:TPA: glycosyltransferase [Pseudomonas putida]
MPEVLYTGAFRFPDGDAAAVRVFTVGKLFEAFGAQVSFAGWEGHEPRTYQFEGHACFSQAEFRSAPQNIVARLLGFLLRGKNTFRWLLKRKYDGVVLYNPPALFALAMLVLARLRGFTLVLDSTEWYESAHLPGGRFGIAALENYVRMKWVYPRFSHVISISRFLDDHLASCANRLQLPPMMVADAASAQSAQPLSSVIRFFYAGDMGKKDSLSAFIGAMGLLERLSGRRIELHIAGLDKPAVIENLARDGVIAGFDESRVTCYGRVTRERVLELYRECHFSIFFRQAQRYALAGFPTKSVESLSLGCPVVTNRVGDIGEILSNGENAFLTDESSFERLGEALASLTPAGYEAMRISAGMLYASTFSVAANVQRFEGFYDKLGLNFSGDN